MLFRLPIFVQGLEFLTGIAAGGVKTPNMVYSWVATAAGAEDHCFRQ
jgi:hypothetical protein